MTAIAGIQTEKPHFQSYSGHYDPYFPPIMPPFQYNGKKGRYHQSQISRSISP